MNKFTCQSIPSSNHIPNIPRNKLRLRHLPNGFDKLLIIDHPGHPIQKHWITLIPIKHNGLIIDLTLSQSILHQILKRLRTIILHHQPHHIFHNLRLLCIHKLYGHILLLQYPPNINERQHPGMPLTRHNPQQIHDILRTDEIVWVGVDV